MKKKIALFVLLFSTQICLGQNNFTFNQGGAQQSNYFSSIPYENINEKIIVNVKINGNSYKFILDTGAPTIISSRLFEALQPTVINKLPISDINQVKDSLSVVSLDDLLLGEVVFSNIPTLVAQQNPIFECFQVDGFIGSNLLRNSVVQINDVSKQLIITDDEKKLNLDPKQSSELLLDNQSGPVIRVSLKGKKGRKEQLLLDLGMSGFYDLSIRQFNIFRKYKIFDILGNSVGNNSIGFFGVANNSQQYRVHLPEMDINGTKILHVSTQTVPGGRSRIGSKILEYGIVTIDYRNKKFHFNPYRASPIDISEKQLPIDFVPNGQQLLVGFVWDPALEGRISVGDQIIAINNTSYEQIQLCDLVTKPSIFKTQDIVTLTTKNAKGEIVNTVIERK